MFAWLPLRPKARPAKPRPGPRCRPALEVLEARVLFSVSKEVLAFYYPWYGNPQVTGHYVHWSGVDTQQHTISNATHYPELGAYDSHDPAVVAQQVSWAVQSGITGFISSWWGPNTFEDQSLPILLNAAEQSGLKVTAYFETVRGTTPTRESALADVLYLLDTYGNNRAWQHSDGKPVLFVYSRAVGQIGLSNWQWVIQQTNQLRPSGAVFVGDQISAAAAQVFDGIHTYNVTGSTQGKTPDQIRTWAHSTYPGWVATAQSHNRIATLTVIPGYDDSKLGRPLPRPITDRANGDTYRVLAQEAMAANPDWLLITSWNEWHEGSEMEPSDEVGHLDLQITAQFAPLFVHGTVDDSNGFLDPAGLRLNGGAALTADYRLRLTDGGQYEGRSAFTAAPVNVQQFSTGFWFQLTNPRADGFTFALQNTGPTAVGAIGGGLGYSGIRRSAAIKFDLYDNAGEGNNSTGLYLNGAAPSLAGSVGLTGTGIDLHSGDLFYAELDYDGATLSVLIYDTVTGAAAVQAYTADLVSVLGGPSAYVGFTGATGGATSTQDILWWTYTPTGGGGGAGGSARNVPAGGPADGRTAGTAFPDFGFYFFAEQSGWYPERDHPFTQAKWTDADWALLANQGLSGDWRPSLPEHL